MIITAFMPYLTFAIAFVLSKITLLKDRRFNFRNKLATRMITIQQYVNAYSGPEVTLYSRYANVLN